MKKMKQLKILLLLVLGLTQFNSVNAQKTTNPAYDYSWMCNIFSSGWYQATCTHRSSGETVNCKVKIEITHTSTWCYNELTEVFMSDKVQPFMSVLNDPPQGEVAYNNQNHAVAFKFIGYFDEGKRGSPSYEYIITVYPR